MRALLLHALPLATLRPSPGVAASVDPFFDRLRARYILLRPGETTFEAAGMVDSNPINKQAALRGLTEQGREQVRAAAEALAARGVTSPVIFYDNGARASQTADILANSLSVPRRDVEPEFRWLEARGLGALDGTDLQAATEYLHRIDAADVESAAEEAEDGTPSDSVNDVFGRMRNTIAKIETSYGGGDFVIIGGDAAVLSVFAAAACGTDLRDHGRFTLPPGGWYDLRQLVADYKAGRFEEAPLPAPSAEEVTRGREALREMGPRIFSDTAAGSCLCCSCKR